MHLSTKLNVQPQQIVQIINELLPKAQVRISYWGERMVSFTGYEGEIRIVDLFTKFLAASAHDTDTPIDVTDKSILLANLQQRVQCYEVWTKLEALHIDSEKELDRGCFKSLVKIKEVVVSRFSQFDSIAIINLKTDVNWKENLLFFTEQQYKAIWRDINP